MQQTVRNGGDNVSLIVVTDAGHVCNVDNSDSSISIRSSSCAVSLCSAVEPRQVYLVRQEIGVMLKLLEDNIRASEFDDLSGLL